MTQLFNSEEGNAPDRRMMYRGQPIAEMDESELDWAAADLIIEQGLVTWGRFFLLVATSRFWVQRHRAMAPVPFRIQTLLSWEALFRGIDALTNRALTRLYFLLYPRPHSSQLMGLIMEAIELPVSPWGVIKPAYGDRILSWK
ncbi:hypothetical protein LCGC14_2225800 [marine sediment metagenome]|uniref:Uncharacterized protein n=1 Tax=marine sediment metagenome TaxID=412755 RepID=A0A0F9DX78_9ZZZZ